MASAKVPVLKLYRSINIMMGHQSKVQNKLFYTAINLEQRVRKNHILRKVKRHIDFDFIYNEVKDKYGINGNESVAPPVILKMMLLLIFYNVRSERELAITIPERLDWLWFLDYDLDDDIPNHSVLSKARARWRRLWRVQIQEYFTATIQNIMVLISNIKEQAPASAIARAKNRYKRVGLSLQQRFYYFKQIVTHIITFLPINLCETND